MTNPTGKPLAVVTGASSGIGYELAKQFAQHGFDLVVAAEDDDISRAARDFEALGATVEAVQTDLASYDGVERLCRQATSNGRSIDALAINAGIGVHGEFASTNLDDELRLIDLNVRSAVHLAKRGVQDMVGRGEGRILFTSSIAATQPGPFEAAYAASKSFLLSFSEALRNELKGTGITVTALMPGPTDTEFFERAGMQDTRVGAGKKDDAAEVARHGFEALMKGKDHVVAGSVKNRVLAGASKLTPETVKAQMHRKMAEPGSGKD
ncbi:SDR family NAD(P)-dependent oxidoreductase [Plantactinospora sp. S1510]|uniref:SDR family NAD(P)-dependent oxidoreductase n=1 Tax=Plantactinospora alkalitolerans TaxID=2789879 RepID=A0ABS0H2D7_9ACTN|nr:SDR family NAD(P)-dependent oxidoreductase [Plantactinospora alkalitolerans]MBF9132610.1 SDR family NAD(P)-dependent oxidoreductase [Plantactinospora alkalitolerans]